MEILSIIPARGGSKAIPMKNLVPLDKRPILEHTVRASLNSSLINRTVVSTDHDHIATEAKRLGAEVIIRPKKLAGDKVAIEPSMTHVLDFLKKTEGYIPDLIVLLQNTSPLRTTKHINDALSLFKNGKYDSVLSGFVSHYFLWKSQGKIVIPTSYNALKRPNRQEMNQFTENGAIYITKYSFFRKSNLRISGKIGMYVMPVENSIEIDSPYDLLVAEQILKKQKEDKM